MRSVWRFKTLHAGHLLCNDEAFRRQIDALPSRCHQSASALRGCASDRSNSLFGVCQQSDAARGKVQATRSQFSVANSRCVVSPYGNVDQVPWLPRLGKLRHSRARGIGAGQHPSGKATTVATTPCIAWQRRLNGTNAQSTTLNCSCNAHQIREIRTNIEQN